MFDRLPPYHSLGSATSFALLFTLLFASYASVWWWAHEPVRAAIAIACLVVPFLAYIKSQKLLVVALLAALLGTAHEAFFASQGYWTYRVASWASIPSYLPSVWAVIGVLSVAIYKGLLRVCSTWLPPARPLSRSAALALTLSGFGLVFWSIWEAASEPWFVVILFVLIEAAYLVIWRNLALALVGGFTLLAGMLADLCFVSLGVWSYPESAARWHSVPVYIFAYWNIMGVLLAGLYASLDSRPHTVGSRDKTP